MGVQEVRQVGAGKPLADFFNELKQRSGYSYEQIGKKCHISRSTIHRYCTGNGVPPDFGTVERIATVCGANQQDITRLFRLWEQAWSNRAASAGAVVEPAEPEPERPANRPQAQPRARRRSVVVAVLAVFALINGSAQPVHSNEPPGVTAAAPAISAPMWTDSPYPVSDGFVGVTVNSTTGTMPSFRVGSVRLWDSETRWQNIEPRRGQFDWSTVDRLVSSARQDGLSVLFTMGGTPDWASPNGPDTPYDDGSRASPPRNMADWDRFVRRVAQRYRGRIDAYELWDMANHPKFFTGSTETLVEMTRRASSQIRAADPDATVVCPSMGELWDRAALQALERFGRLGGYNYCDVAAVKLYPRKASDPPETMLNVANEVYKSFHRSGAHLGLWSTGSGFDIPLQRPVRPELAADHAVRFYLTGIYAQYQRMYFYNWGSAKVPLVLQPEGGKPTKAALFVEELRRWLHDARVHSCGRGAPAGLPKNMWQCRFDRGGKAFLIWWTHVGTARMTPAAGASAVQRLDGTTSPVDPAKALVVTPRPVLLRIGRTTES
ncbi:MAG: helix-turn-helix domain-containing protein [Pseudonocardiaceae bacterium]|nr:helix-turn-helix domain-containing protein [Pseudonocardiaceae bacterium]